MSHFLCVVLVAPSVPDVEAEVGRLLVPYDENTQVPEYDRPCYCIGQVARTAAREQADAECGSYDALRESFRPTNDAFLKRHGARHAFDLPEAAGEELDALWDAHRRARETREHELFEAHPQKEQPDPTCGFYTERYCPDGHTPGERFEDGSGCGGIGTERSTYNPQSEWDWWRVGGRWDGALLGKDEEEQRSTDGGYNWGDSHTSLQHNTLPVRELLRRQPDFSCFALLTPDGKWHERGDMGWFGMTRNEQPKEEWVARLHGLLRDYPDHLAVGVDCHI